MSAGDTYFFGANRAYRTIGGDCDFCFLVGEMVEFIRYIKTDRSIFAIKDMSGNVYYIFS